MRQVDAARGSDAWDRFGCARPADRAQPSSKIEREESRVRDRVQGHGQEPAAGRAKRSGRERAGRGSGAGILPSSLILLLMIGSLLGMPRSARAATRSGNLPASASAARLLFLDCSDDGAGAPLSATVQIRDLSPVAAPLVSVQLRKGTAATNSTDAVDGDGSASPLVFVNGGSGRYDVYVDKTEAGGEAFEVLAQCWTGAGGTGAPTGTALSSATGVPVPFSTWPGQAALVACLVGVARRALRRARPGRNPVSA